ncbi:hypothetical protein Gpo141_00011977 [Globisporangium polare]
MAHRYPGTKKTVEPAAATTTTNDTSHDEQLAKELQAQFDRNQGHAVAAPPQVVPFSCGACGTTHAVRDVSHGAVFKCVVCGVENRILLEQHRPVVVVDKAYPVPIPIFCSIL